MDGIEIKDKEYDTTEVFIDSDTEDNDDTLGGPIISDPNASLKHLSAFTANTSETNSDFDYICGPCVGSKSTQVVIRNKNMTSTKKKLEEVHADLWGPHHPASWSGNTYAAILMCKHSWKT